MNLTQLGVTASRANRGSSVTSNITQINHLANSYEGTLPASGTSLKLKLGWRCDRPVGLRQRIDLDEKKDPDLARKIL
jgi:hypothetical protein